MAVETFRAGRPARGNNWQDWVNLGLAGWLFASPWILQFGGTVRTPTLATMDGGISAVAAADAAWNCWVAGGIVVIVALSAIGRMELWQERINLVLGIWIFIAPWAIGFAGLAPAAWDHWVVGALVFLVSLSLCTAARSAPRAGN